MHSSRIRPGRRPEPTGQSPYIGSPVGVERWNFTAGWVYSSPAIGADGTIYVGSVTYYHLYAISSAADNVFCLSGYKLNASTGLGLENWAINVTNSTGAVVGSNVTDGTGYRQVLTPVGLIALVGLLSAIAAVAIVGKRRSTSLVHLFFPPPLLCRGSIPARTSSWT